MLLCMVANQLAGRIGLAALAVGALLVALALGARARRAAADA
jgi:hypothetical protein